MFKNQIKITLDQFENYDCDTLQNLITYLNDQLNNIPPEYQNQTLFIIEKNTEYKNNIITYSLIYHEKNKTNK
jgi:hypothetical protein